MGSSDEAVISFIGKLLQDKRELTDEFLKLELRGRFAISEVKRIELLSLMHQCGLIGIRQQGGDVIYSANQKEKDEDHKFSSEAESKLYEEIRASEGKGVGKLELKSRTKLNQGLITKCLKSLEKLGYISAHKSKDKNKVLYFSTDFEPDEALIGGNLYKDGEIDYEFLASVNQLVLDFLGKRPEASYFDLFGFVTSRPEGSVLSAQEIQLVLNNLCLDKKIVKKGDKFSQAVKAQNELGNGFEKQIPCFKCQVFQLCKTGSVVSPENCIYFENW